MVPKLSVYLLECIVFLYRSKYFLYSPCGLIPRKDSDGGGGERGGGRAVVGTAPPVFWSGQKYQHMDWGGPRFNSQHPHNGS
jgi:hypothetical protein